jgi:hypoxanthine phosphoribosyltransferase
LVWNDENNIAQLISNVIPPFNNVVGIPKGGTRLASLLSKYTNGSSNRILIVDDVLTTGNSMETKKKEIESTIDDGKEVIGVVMFARNECPDWVIPIFTLDERFRSI